MSRVQVLRAGEPQPSDFARDLLAGLAAQPKSIAAKYFYDERGSELFEQICEQPEYYPPRIEMQMLRDNAAEFAALAGEAGPVIEFGAGALRKVEILLDALGTRHYLPVDISGAFLQRRAAELRRLRPDLSVHPVIADFTAPFALPFASERPIGFFPGSTIGNLDPEDAVRFLRRARTHLKDGALLIGVDLVKDPAVLHRAYNDAAGVTAAFNRNLLLRANRELGADFDPGAFDHYAFYNPWERRMEMHLVSARPQTVSLLGESFGFAEGEAIHTENSYKHTPDSFQLLALEAGFVPRQFWLDEKRLFSLHWLENPG